MQGSREFQPIHNRRDNVDGEDATLLGVFQAMLFMLKEPSGFSFNLSPRWRDYGSSVVPGGVLPPATGDSRSQGAHALANQMGVQLQPSNHAFPPLCFFALPGVGPAAVSPTPVPPPFYKNLGLGLLELFKDNLDQ
jgi:hypothetical protein